MQISANIIGTSVPTAYRIKIVFRENDQGVIFSNQADYVNNTVLTIGASVSSQGLGPGSSNYSGVLDSGKIFSILIIMGHFSNPTIHSF